MTRPNIWDTFKQKCSKANPPFAIIELSEQSYKIVFLGESWVGKSSIVLRLVDNRFDQLFDPTIGAAYMQHYICASDDVPVRFEIWDTAGQERYGSLAPMYYREASIVVSVYDITDCNTYDKAKNWVMEIRMNAGKFDPIIALVGNKVDQADIRAVDTDEASRYAEENDLIFFETSAKLGTNVEELFRVLANRAYTRDPTGDLRRGAQRISLDRPDAVNIGQIQSGKLNGGCKCQS